MDYDPNDLKTGVTAGLIAAQARKSLEQTLLNRELAAADDLRRQFISFGQPIEPSPVFALYAIRLIMQEDWDSALAWLAAAPKSWEWEGWSRPLEFPAEWLALSGPWPASKLARADTILGVRPPRDSGLFPMIVVHLENVGLSKLSFNSQFIGWAVSHGFGVYAQETIRLAFAQVSPSARFSLWSRIHELFRANAQSTKQTPLQTIAESGITDALAELALTLVKDVVNFDFVNFDVELLMQVLRDLQLNEAQYLRWRGLVMRIKVALTTKGRKVEAERMEVLMTAAGVNIPLPISSSQRKGSRYNKLPFDLQRDMPSFIEAVEAVRKTAADPNRFVAPWELVDVLRAADALAITDEQVESLIPVQGSWHVAWATARMMWRIKEDRLIEALHIFGRHFEPFYIRSMVLSLPTEVANLVQSGSESQPETAVALRWPEPNILAVTVKALVRLTQHKHEDLARLYKALLQDLDSREHLPDRLRPELQAFLPFISNWTDPHWALNVLVDLRLRNYRLSTPCWNAILSKLAMVGDHRMVGWILEKMEATFFQYQREKQYLDVASKYPGPPVKNEDQDPEANVNDLTAMGISIYEPRMERLPTPPPDTFRDIVQWFGTYPPVSVSTYNTILRGYNDRRLFKEAMDVVQRMKLAGVDLTGRNDTKLVLQWLSRSNLPFLEEAGLTSPGKIEISPTITDDDDISNQPIGAPG